MSAQENPIDLTSIIVKFCQQSCQQVTAIALFGSYANGKAHDKSDVDVIVIDESCQTGYRKQERVDGFLI